MIYTCDLCDKSFDRKSNYITHSNRKNPCVAKPTLSRIDILELDKNATEERLKSQDDEIEKLKEQIAQLHILIKQKN